MLVMLNGRYPRSISLHTPDIAARCDWLRMTLQLGRRGAFSVHLTNLSSLVMILLEFEPLTTNLTLTLAEASLC